MAAAASLVNDIRRLIDAARANVARGANATQTAIELAHRRAHRQRVLTVSLETKLIEAGLPALDN